MASFLQTLSQELGKLKFKDFVAFGALSAILTQSLRKKKKQGVRVKPKTSSGFVNERVRRRVSKRLRVKS